MYFFLSKVLLLCSLSLNHHNLVSAFDTAYGYRDHLADFIAVKKLPGSLPGALNGHFAL